MFLFAIAILNIVYFLHLLDFKNENNEYLLTYVYVEKEALNENTKPDGSSLVVSLASYVSMAALWTRAGHYIFALWFFFILCSFFLA